MEISLEETTLKDYSFMCFELMWMAFSEVHGLTDKMPIIYETVYDRAYGEEYFYKSFVLKIDIMPSFAAYVEEEWKNIQVSARQSTHSNKTWHHFSGKIDIPQISIWYLYQMYPDTSVRYELNVSQSINFQYQKNWRS